MSAKYKFLDDLTPDQRDALTESIRARGLDHPIIKDEEGNILDGHERAAICEALRLRNYPVKTVDCRDMDETEKRVEVFRLNNQRRHRDRAGLWRCIDAVLRAVPDLTDRFVGQILFVDHKTVSKRRAALVAADEIPAVKKFRGSDGREWRRTAVITTTAQEEAMARDLLAELEPGDLPRRTMTTKHAKAVGARKRYARKAALPVEGYRPEADIVPHHCAFSRLAAAAGLRPASVPLVWTDPLYQKDEVPQYGDLARFAAEYLIPGGVCACYAGDAYIPEIVSLMAAHLTWHWQCALWFCEKTASGKARFNGSTLAHDRQMVNGKRTILIWTRGKARKWDRYVPDRFSLSGRPGSEKDHHPYQQDLEATCYYVEKFSQPGELVVDPFMGSGTTAVACRRRRRRFIGCDRDESAYRAALRRLAEEQKADPLRLRS